MLEFSEFWWESHHSPSSKPHEDPEGTPRCRRKRGEPEARAAEEQGTAKGVYGGRNQEGLCR